MSGTSKSQHTPPDQLARLIGAAILLVMLDYGRDVLIPVVLAVFLALLIAPLIRRLRHWGLGQTQAVALSVLLLFVGVASTTMVLGSQAIRLASSLPQYERTIRDKLQSVDKLTLGKLNAIVNQADHLASKLSPEHQATPPGFALTPNTDNPTPPLRVQIEPPHAKPFEIVTSVVHTVLPPLETGGIVLIVLIFILLDYDSLRDRVIRLISGGNLRATTQAISDATERLSRFFVSQFAVNALVGSLVALALGLAGLSGALFWGALTAVARFIPYIGIWIAAGAATVMAAAMSEGWSLMLITVLIFLFIEIVIAQFFEPKLYGHSTGLSPLSVVIAAIFWSAMWGPVGLILSTPLTLCLVVAGRYVRALNFLEILLGDISALSLAERFYQRSLSGDSAELVRGLRKFLKDKPLHQYSDQVMLAAIRLAYIDFSENEITREEQAHMNHAILALTNAMAHQRLTKPRSRAASVLATVSGKADTRRAKPLAAPEHSVYVTHLDGPVSSLVAQVMVNVLHSEHMPARLIEPAALSELAGRQDIPLVIVSCVAPEDHARALGETLTALRALQPHTPLAVMRVLEEIDAPFTRPSAAECGADAMVGNYQDAVDLTYSLLAKEARAAQQG